MVAEPNVLHCSYQSKIRSQFSLHPLLKPVFTIWTYVFILFSTFRFSKWVFCTRSPNQNFVRNPCFLHPSLIPSTSYLPQFNYPQIISDPLSCQSPILSSCVTTKPSNLCNINTFKDDLQILSIAVINNKE
jgi:hypothetical protein